MASLVAGASLMVDYVLTVAVSISAGVAAIISIPEFAGLRDASGGARASDSSCSSRLMNMRGMKESGQIFAVPTYIYMLVFGVAHRRTGSSVRIIGDIGPIPFNAELVRGRSSSSAASLSVVPAAEGLLVGRGRAHRRRSDLERRAVRSGDRSRRTRRRRSCGWACCSARMFFGISILAHRLQPYPSHDRTVHRAARPRGVRQWAPCSCSCNSRPQRSSCSRRTPRTTGSRVLSSIIAKRRLPTAPAHEPWRPARVLERDHHARGRRCAAAGRVRWAHERADSAVCGRCVHVVHALASRAWCGTTCELREPRWRRSIVLNGVGGGRDARSCC